MPETEKVMAMAAKQIDGFRVRPALFLPHESLPVPWMTTIFQDNSPLQVPVSSVKESFQSAMHVDWKHDPEFAWFMFRSYTAIREIFTVFRRYTHVKGHYTSYVTEKDIESIHMSIHPTLDAPQEECQAFGNFRRVFSRFSYEQTAECLGTTWKSDEGELDRTIFCVGKKFGIKLIRGTRDAIIKDEPGVTRITMLCRGKPTNDFATFQREHNAVVRVQREGRERDTTPLPRTAKRKKIVRKKTEVLATPTKVRKATAVKKVKPETDHILDNNDNWPWLETFVMRGQLSCMFFHGACFPMCHIIRDPQVIHDLNYSLNMASIYQHRKTLVTEPAAIVLGANPGDMIFYGETGNDRGTVWDPSVVVPDSQNVYNIKSRGKS